MNLDESMPSVSAFDRLEKEYIPASSILLIRLEGFAGYGPNKEVSRKYQLDSYNYWECSIVYEECCDLLLYDVRNGVDIHMNENQLKEILRLRHMLRKFDKIMLKEEYPKDQQGLENYIESHPQWKRMSVQANKALDLLRKKPANS